MLALTTYQMLVYVFGGSSVLFLTIMSVMFVYIVNLKRRITLLQSPDTDCNISNDVCSDPIKIEHGKSRKSINAKINYCVKSGIPIGPISALKIGTCNSVKVQKMKSSCDRFQNLTKTISGLPNKVGLGKIKEIANFSSKKDPHHSSDSSEINEKSIKKSKKTNSKNKNAENEVNTITPKSPGFVILDKHGRYAKENADFPKLHSLQSIDLASDDSGYSNKVLHNTRTSNINLDLNITDVGLVNSAESCQINLANSGECSPHFNSIQMNSNSTHLTNLSIPSNTTCPSSKSGSNIHTVNNFNNIVINNRSTVPSRQVEDESIDGPINYACRNKRYTLHKQSLSKVSKILSKDFYKDLGFQVLLNNDDATLPLPRPTKNSIEDSDSASSNNNSQTVSNSQKPTKQKKSPNSLNKEILKTKKSITQYFSDIPKDISKSMKDSVSSGNSKNGSTKDSANCNHSSFEDDSKDTCGRSCEDISESENNDNNFRRIEMEQAAEKNVSIKPGNKKSKEQRNCSATLFQEKSQLRGQVSSNSDKSTGFIISKSPVFAAKYDDAQKNTSNNNTCNNSNETNVNDKNNKNANNNNCVGSPNNYHSDKARRHASRQDETELTNLSLSDEPINNNENAIINYQNSDSSNNLIYSSNHNMNEMNLLNTAGSVNSFNLLRNFPLGRVPITNNSYPSLANLTVNSQQLAAFTNTIATNMQLNGQSYSSHQSPATTNNSQNQVNYNHAHQPVCRTEPSLYSSHNDYRHRINSTNLSNIDINSANYGSPIIDKKKLENKDSKDSVLTSSTVHTAETFVDLKTENSMSQSCSCSTLNTLSCNCYAKNQTQKMYQQLYEKAYSSEKILGVNAYNTAKSGSSNLNQIYSEANANYLKAHSQKSPAVSACNRSGVHIGGIGYERHHTAKKNRFSNSTISKLNLHQSMSLPPLGTPQLKTVEI